MKSMLTIAAAASALAAALPAAAEIKTDGLWRGAGGLAFASTSGNTHSTNLQLNVDTLRATQSDRITLGAAANYASNKTDGEKKTTANKWGAFGQYDLNLSPQMYVFGRLGLDGDKLIDLSLRTSVAGGLGYKLVDTKETTFELFGGAGYSTDSYDTAQTVGSKTAKRFSRTSLYLGEQSSHQLSASTTFKQRLDLYPGLTGDKAKLAKFTASLNVAMSSTLGMSLGLVDNYNSKPPAGARKNDLGVFAGITVKFGAD